MPSSQKDKERMARWYRANKDSANAKSRDKYSHLSDEEMQALRDYRHAYYVANKEKILARSRRRYETKTEQVRQQAKEHYLNDPVGKMLERARQRARKIGVPWALTRQDIVIPDTCPVLGIPMSRVPYGTGKAHSGSPSLDRINPELGYVPSNIQVISYKANCMKNNATAEELLAFAAWVNATFSPTGSTVSWWTNGHESNGRAPLGPA